jgi:sigma-E factor negative regulatory protein RseA
MTMPPSPAAADPSACGAREWISRLADGDHSAADAACRHWRDDADAREAWHLYHLIGDSLRSDELARADVAGDERFLATLRERLADEPVVLAPAPVAWTPLAASPKPRRLPLALAAGVLAVGAAAVVWNLSRSGAADRAPLLADAGLGNGGTVAQNAVSGKLVRDERLDSYLRLHRGGATALPGTGGGRFETVAFER